MTQPHTCAWEHQCIYQGTFQVRH